MLWYQVYMLGALLGQVEPMHIQAQDLTSAISTGRALAGVATPRPSGFEVWQGLRCLHSEAVGA